MVTPHPRIMQRRLDVALSGAQATCLQQIDALYDSLAVLGRSGFAEARPYQDALSMHRATLAGLDPHEPTGATTIMEQIVALCGTMEQAMASLQAFLSARS